MKPGIYDKALDKLNKRIGTATDIIKENFKDSVGFRQPVVSDRERYNQYSQNFTPEVEQVSRQEQGDEFTDKFISDMEKLRRQYEGVK